MDRAREGGEWRDKERNIKEGEKTEWRRSRERMQKRKRKTEREILGANSLRKLSRKLL